MITIYSKIPYDLKELDRWVCWRYEKDKTGKPTKVPIDAKTGLRGNSIDKSTWSSFDVAVDAERTRKLDGIGIMLGEGLMGVDLDDVKDDIIDYKNGFDNNIVSEFIDQLCSYAEISPSGNGIHILLYGSVEAKGNRKGKVEIYQKDRFFTVTGNAIGGYTHIAEDELNVMSRLHEKYIGIREQAIEDVGKELIGNNVPVDELIEKAKNSSNGTKFKVLFDGGWEDLYESQSEADLAFCNMTAYWTAFDLDKMDTMYRMSNLYKVDVDTNRNKWDRRQNDSTWGMETMQKAIAETNNYYQPNEDLIFTIADGSDGSIKKVEREFYSYDDDGNGKRLADMFEPILRYHYSRKMWVTYNGKKWELDDSGKSRLIVNERIERMKTEPIHAFDKDDTEEAEKLKQKHLKYSRSTSGKNNMLTEAEPLLGVPHDMFDADDKLLNVRNGYIDLTTGELHEHDREKYFLKLADVDYTRNIDAPLWENFLHTIFAGDEELIKYIQRAIGYSLSGETIEEKMFILHGSGRNGKSVFLNIIRKMLGDYTMNINADTLMKSHQNTGGGPSGHIARLADARFVTASEPSQGNKFDEGQVKNMTGTGDPLTARFMHGQDFDFLPKFKVWLATNHKPLISGTDMGIWRRFSIIPFTVTIPDEKIDPYLSDKLMQELPGIMKWAVDGYIEWQRIGLQEPLRVKQELEIYRTEMDSIEQWIMEKAERVEGHFETTRDLYESYDAWATESRSYNMSYQKFAKETKDKFEEATKNNKRGRIGLKLNEFVAHDEPNLYKLNFNRTIQN